MAPVRRWAVAALLAYAALVLTLSLARTDTQGRVHTTLAKNDLAPVVNSDSQQRKETLRLDIAFNLTMLAPIGALLPLAVPRWRARQVLLALLALSGAIELLQLTVFTYRYAQLSDVALNVLGGSLGYAAVRLWERRQ